MEKKIKKDDPKYFYAVVLITIGIATGVIWQIFFTDYMAGVPDPRLERIPDVSFMMLDSYLFREMDPFIRGDRYLLPWEEMVEPDPFSPPRVPLSGEMRNWWSVFNIALDIDEENWIGLFPEMIFEDENPTLILLVDRWYEFDLSAIEEDCDFEIFDKDEEVVDLFEVEREEKIFYRIRTKEDLTGYGCKGEELTGDIMIVGFDDYDREDIYQESTSQVLIEAGFALSDLLMEIEKGEEWIDSQTLNEYRNAFSRMENNLESLNSQHESMSVDEVDSAGERESQIKSNAEEIIVEAERRRTDLEAIRESLEEE